MEIIYKIKNWGKLQHFKDRSPPWIKLYKEILDDYDINLISSDAFKFLIQCWLVASEQKSKDGTLPKVDQLSYRLRLTKSKCCELLRQIDIFLISTRYQDDAPETETETETETDMESKKFVKPTIQEIRGYCTLRNNTVNPEAFLDFYESKGWVIGRSPMKSWQAAVRTWEKNSQNNQNQQTKEVDGVWKKK